MKKLLFILSICSPLCYSMERKETHEKFIQEFYDKHGYTSYSLITKIGIRNTPFAEDFKKIIPVYYDRIIDTQFDASIKNFCKQNPENEQVKIINRWVKAVAFKVYKYHDNPELIDNRFQEMVAAVPLDIPELVYIDKSSFESLGFMFGKLNQKFFSDKMQTILGKARLHINLNLTQKN